MIAFLLLLSIAVIIYVVTRQSEGFESNADISKNIERIVDEVPNCPKGSSIIPVKGIMPRMMKSARAKPYSMPGEIPVAPYQQLAAMSPLPYQDTTLIKANQQQLVSLLEMLKGFFAFEAQELNDSSDPSIQLPLQTSRSDMQVLQREVDVQTRNPGIQSTITLSQLNEMSSNLAYLQEKVRLLGASEGFQNKRTTDVATVKELTEFMARIQGEKIRLSASGTTDIIVKRRTQELSQMYASVNDIIEKVKKGLMPASEIPIMKSDIDKAFPILGNPSEPLPQILKLAKLPEGWANILPSSLTNNPQTVQQISRLLDTYGQQFIDGVSATFQVKYTPPIEVNVNSTVDQIGFPSVSDLNNVSNRQFIPMDQGSLTDPLAQQPYEAGRGPGHFDWKTRAKEIENQVKQRGLNSSDFGITDITNPSNDFSWKGYARMICTRLQATMDPGLPETCGCPPLSWKGWRP